MNLRRLPMLGVCALGALTVATAGRELPDPLTAVFSESSAAVPWMPSAPITTPLSTTWFCPGVPAADADDVGGEVVIANTDEVALDAQVSLLGIDGDPVEQEVTVEPRGRATIDVDEAITSDYAGAIVEITGGAGVVEQRATNPLGDGAVARSVAPCTTTTSTTWYLAEGYTQEGSREQLIVMNPYPSEATVAIRFATQGGTRAPTDLQSELIPPFSVRVYDMADLAARDEPEVAVTMEATRGAITVARAQTYVGTGRRGYAVTLAAPAARTQWYFVDGESGEGITERYSIYNPGDERIEVQASVVGIDLGSDFIPIEPIEVGRGQVATFSPDDVTGLPEGRHAFVFAAQSLDQGVVVERALSRTFEGLPTTSVTLGAPPRYQDGYVASTWTMAIGVDEPTLAALAAYNIDAADATVTVQAVTPEGIVNVPGLEAVALPANGLVTIDLTDDVAIDHQLIVRSTSRIFVERLLPRDEGSLGRVASWPLPAQG
ncbi:MAG: DUF5719 family protein [Desertimonas sp.]